jgi:predicted ABC-type ATPase
MTRRAPVDKRPFIHVVAGTNGAGKSSVAGKSIRERGGAYFNPDEFARRLLDDGAATDLREANILAWTEGKRMLEEAIITRRDFAFETTLGGNTIPALLETAANGGHAVRIWFVGLESVELHLERVRARVAGGGHDIPEAMIRARYDNSRLNLIRLLPGLAELTLFDNSAPGDPQTGQRPQPKSLLAMREGMIVGSSGQAVPGWARPIFLAAMTITPMLGFARGVLAPDPRVYLVA